MATQIICADEAARELFGKSSIAGIAASDQPLVLGAVKRANAAIAALLNDNIGHKPRAEFLSLPPENRRTGPLGVISHGSIRERLPLKFSPVAIETIELYESRKGRKLIGEYGDDDRLTLGEDYEIECDRQEIIGEALIGLPTVTLRRCRGGWPKSGAVLVRYTGGIDADVRPDHWELIRTATLQTFQAQFFALAKQTASAGEAGPLASESIGKYSYSVNTGAMRLTSGGVAASAMATLADVIDYGVFL